MTAPILKRGDTIILEVARHLSREAFDETNNQLKTWFASHGIDLGATIETDDANVKIVAVIRND